MKRIRNISIFILFSLLTLTIYQGNSYGYQPAVTWAEADRALLSGQMGFNRMQVSQLRHVTGTAPTPPEAQTDITYIAHRGYSAAAPENTIPAIVKAFQHGAHGVEIDVQMTGDGYAIVFHDHTLKRTTNGSGFVRFKKLNDLKALDAGSWFRNGDYTGTAIPTFGEALDAMLPYRNPIVYTEIKDYRNPQDIQAIVESAKKKGWEKRMVFSSFSGKDLKLVREHTTEALIGFICDSSKSCNKALNSAAEDGHAMIHASFMVLLEEPRIVELALQRGVGIAAWTVNSPETRDRLVALGVTTFITDQPEWLSKVEVQPSF
ncbi:glycerophosphodiester phosphodiesterase [Paenibacillus senegalensis]|uniref:glycerophosphodiester phosphodiesterase n=1 Tax=Paenibacillus senegalensis TaxID=1465766 RepID=UPI00028849EF|nr:glycerophosphodiester phosphodiesterase family protein [Paenibacillus senegalensis]